MNVTTGKQIKRYRDAVYAAAGTALILVYIYLWRTTDGVLHNEIMTLPNWLQGGMGGFGDFIRKSFNLGMIENGCYRPRIGAFMLEYLDIMLWKTFNLSRGGGRRTSASCPSGHTGYDCGMERYFKKSFGYHELAVPVSDRCRVFVFDPLSGCHLCVFAYSQAAGAGSGIMCGSFFPFREDAAL